MKYCKQCKSEKPLSEFFKHRSHKDGLQAYCKTCWKSYARSPEKKVKENERNLNNNRSEKRYLYARNYNMKRKYGIGINEYNAMLIAQSGKCAICEKDHVDCRNGLYVDHDHASGKVRSLLCQECNTGLGNFKDSRDIVIKALHYIDRHLDNDQVIPLKIHSVNR